MSVRQLAIACLACLILAGCQTDPYIGTHIEMLNAAKRSLEDRVYELEYECEAQARQAERLRAENERLRKEGASGFREPNGLDIQPPEVRIPPTRSQTAPAVPAAPEFRPEDLRPPLIEPGVSVDPSLIEPRVPPAAPAKPAGSGASSGSPPPLATVRLEAEDPRITAVYIDPDRTQGSNWDARSGDDGLLLVLQPRNEQGKYIPLAGPISVVALDPAEPGEQKRFARWELTAEEVDRQMRQSDSRQGIPLQLPWPASAPKHDRLRLYVRYTTVDGRQVEASQDVVVNAAARLTRAWTPRPAGWEQPSPALPSSDAAAPPEWSPFR